MNRNRTIGVVILLIVVALISWFAYRKHKDNTTTTNPNLSVAAYNTTQNADVAAVTSHPKDNIAFTLTAANPSDKVISGFVIEVGISDVTKNATLIDAQGANYDSGSNSLVWTPLDIPANGSIQKQFTVRVKDTLPANTADRVIKLTYSNQVVVNLNVSNPSTSPTGRPGTVGTGSTYHAPKTGIPGWISFYLAAFITFGIMLVRMANKLGRPMNKR
jgi:hypothetical protein